MGSQVHTLSDRPALLRTARTRLRNARARGLGWLLFFSLCALIGVLFAFWTLPRIFRHAPHDLKRTGTLLSALGTGKPVRLVLFGNSVAMNGFDTRLLAQSTGQPLAYNLSSTGQSLAEGFLYYQQLPDSVRQVVHVLYPTQLCQQQFVSDNVLDVFRLYGFSPTPLTTKTLERVFGSKAATLKPQSTLIERFSSRWTIRQGLDTAMRRLLRRDLNLRRAEEDLFHPAPYTRPVASKALRANLGVWHKTWRHAVAKSKATGALVHPGVREFLQRLAAINRARRRQWTIVLAPVHPVLQREFVGTLDALRQVAGQLSRRLNATLVDLTLQLAAPEFIDAVHPTLAGAERLTRILAARLGEAKG